MNEYLSDHIPIYAVFKKVRNQHRKKQVVGRSYKNYNKNKLIEVISKNVCAETLENMDADGLAILLIESVSAYLDEDCHIRNFNIPEEDRPWVDGTIRQMIKDRRRHLRLADQFIGPGENKDLKEAHRLRQSIDRRGRQNMARIIKNKLALYRKNPKKFWAELNRLWKDKKLHSTISLIDEDTGGTVTYDSTADK